ncbi:MAG TPA: hypothetical protein VFP89_02305 [Propionibacteriaceae bacterium]|nr:hypothetical protein [Propionibacteriaceae bacterium]
MTAATTPNRPLFPEPIDPTYPTAGGAGAIYGIHAAFCMIDGADGNGHRHPGQSVEIHGLTCESASTCAPIAALLRDGRPERLYCDLVAPYFHGVYDPAEAAIWPRNPLVRITADDDGLEFFISSSAARSLAAALIHAADRIELS